MPKSNSKTTGHNLPSLCLINRERTLCLFGKLSDNEVEMLIEDSKISEKQMHFSFEMINISEEAQLVGVYTELEHRECVFEEFETGVMGDAWRNKFQKILPR